MEFKISVVEGAWAREISIFAGVIEYENPSILMTSRRGHGLKVSSLSLSAIRNKRLIIDSK